MTTNKVQVEIPHYIDPTHGTEELDIDAAFDIPISTKIRTLALIGLILHIIGWIIIIVMGILFIVHYPQNWEPKYPVPLEGGGPPQDEIQNTEDVQQTKELVVALAIFGSAPLLLGLALYTYGRTFRGDQDEASGGRTAVYE